MANLAQYAPKPVTQHPDGKPDRETIASIVNTDKVKLGNGNLITVDASIAKLRKGLKIPKPTMQRNDPCSDKQVVLMALGFACDTVTEMEQEAAKFPEKSEASTPAA